MVAPHAIIFIEILVETAKYINTTVMIITIM